jgi:hypothetical protein
MGNITNIPLTSVLPANLGVSAPVVDSKTIAQSINDAENAAIAAKPQPKAAVDNAHIRMIEEGNIPPANVYVVSDSVFTLYKMADGKMYSRVRNLKTGQTVTFPHLDTFSYNEAIRAQRGVLFEGKA